MFWVWKSSIFLNLGPVIILLAVYRELSNSRCNKQTVINGENSLGKNKLSKLAHHPDFVSGCKKTLNDSFGQLNITYNETFSPDCVWTIGNSGMCEPVAVVSIEKVQLTFCRYEAVLTPFISPTMKRGGPCLSIPFPGSLFFHFYCIVAYVLFDFASNNMKVNYMKEKRARKTKKSCQHFSFWKGTSSGLKTLLGVVITLRGTHLDPILLILAWLAEFLTSFEEHNLYTRN